MTSIFAQVTQADWLFIASGFVGMVAHYLKKRARKETGSSLTGYFGTDNLNNTLTTFGAFGMAVIGALSTGIIAPDATIWAVLYAGLTTGYAVDSGFNKGTPHPKPKK